LCWAHVVRIAFSPAHELTGRGGKPIAVTTDVSDREQVKNLVDVAAQAYGGLT